MKNKFTIFTIAIVLITAGCCHYTVTPKGVKSNCRINNGFFLHKITVESFDENGIPKKYTQDTTIHCIANSGYSTKEFHEKLTDQEIALFEKCQNVLDSISKSKNNYVKIAELSDKESAAWWSATRTQDSILDAHFPFKPQKKIHFNKANKNYKWIMYNSFEVSYVLPFTFLKNSWYYIRGLSGDGSGIADFDVFIYIDNEGKWHQYNDYHPGPF